MKVLITGGTGFVGSYFAKSLLLRGAEVVLFDRVAAGKNSSSDFVEADIRDYEALSNAMSGVDCVLHLAAAHHDFGLSQQTYHDVNVVGTENVCRAMTANSVKRLCFFSSVAVYGTQDTPPTEASPCEPMTDYGKTKLAAEQVCQRWTDESKECQCLIIRPTVIFGPENYANMYSLIRQIESGRFLRVGEMNNVKSLAYVQNIVEATSTLWLDQEDQRDGCERFNYVDIPDLTSWEIVQTISQALDRQKKLIQLPYWLVRLLAIPFDLVIKLTGANLPISSARVRKLARAKTQVNAEKVHAATGINSVPLREAIATMVEWYQSSGDHASLDRRPPASI